MPEPNREFARLFRPTDSYPQWAAIVELPASDLGTSALSNWVLRSAIDEARIVGARVTENGIDVPWNAVVRSEDMNEDDPIFMVATLLAA